MGGEAIPIQTTSVSLRRSRTSGKQACLVRSKSYSNFCSVEFRKNVKAIMRAMLFKRTHVLLTNERPQPFVQVLQLADKLRGIGFILALYQLYNEL